MSVFLAKAAAYVTTLTAQFRAIVRVAEPEPVDYPFAASDVAQWHRVRHAPGAASVDESTRSGLLLDDYFTLITAQVSIFGKQVLHHRLADGLDDAARAALVERLQALMRDPDRLESLSHACRALRSADTEIAALLLEARLPPIPRWAGYSWLLFAGLAASLAAGALSPLAWLGAGYCMYQLIALQMRYAEPMAAWERAMQALRMLLRTSSLLAALPDPLLDEFTGAGALAGQINRRLTRIPGLDAMGVRAYLDWFLAANVNHYFRAIGVVGRHRAFLIECYLRCANLEADIALARHLLATASTCWAERGGEGTIALELAVHPLLPRPAALSIALAGKGAFISGQNGIGKSTLLRTIGLNLLVARAFGFCYAGKARVPMLPVYASMHSEDSLLGGESLYMAELQRARELLAVADGPHRASFLIDEIFRGTNHLESVSAAAAVLDVLAAHNMVIVSSHNLMLASLLEHRLVPLCVAPDAAGALTLAPGLLAHTNGIALLAQRGFDAAIEANAAKVFNWLGSYLAQPGSGSHLLGTPAEQALRRA
ncbi:MAG: hypothetical protein QFF03_02450 [Pseudomonadota bacterium]|nr:hypothetical protein [Pseudomonadota bacterium]